MQAQTNTASNADGVEITSEMVEAGFSVLSFRYDPDASERNRRGVVRDMYLAMTSAKLEDSAD